jgi:hypothetical protein
MKIPDIGLDRAAPERQLGDERPAISRLPGEESC